MRDMMPLISNATLLDLSLPGTHDSMTWDLDLLVADGANDIPANVSALLHDLGNFLDLGDWLRNQVRVVGLLAYRVLPARGHQFYPAEYDAGLQPSAQCPYPYD
jgi:hypothetical protein